MLKNRYIQFAIGTFVGILLIVIALNTWNADASVTSMASVEKNGIPIYSVKTQEKVCSITFDCAWSADDIESILSTLKKTDVKATFFVVGLWAQKNPEAIKLIEKAGHDISCHGYTHLKFPSLEKGRAKLELENFVNLIKSIIKKDKWEGMDLFRAPYGDWDKNVVNLASEQGFYTIQWSVDTLDYKPNISKSFILNKVNSNLNPGGIILMHTGTKLTSGLLEETIKNIWAKGYAIVPVSKLIYKKDFDVDQKGLQISR